MYEGCKLQKLDLYLSQSNQNMFLKKEDRSNERKTKQSKNLSHCLITTMEAVAMGSKWLLSFLLFIMQSPA